MNNIIICFFLVWLLFLVIVLIDSMMGLMLSSISYLFLLDYCIYILFDQLLKNKK